MKAVLISLFASMALLACDGGGDKPTLTKQSGGSSKTSKKPGNDKQKLISKNAFNRYLGSYEVAENSKDCEELKDVTLATDSSDDSVVWMKFKNKKFDESSYPIFEGKLAQDAKIKSDENSAFYSSGTSQGQTVQEISIQQKDDSKFLLTTRRYDSSSKDLFDESCEYNLTKSESSRSE